MFTLRAFWELETFFVFTHIPVWQSCKITRKSQKSAKEIIRPLCLSMNISATCNCTEILGNNLTQNKLNTWLFIKLLILNIPFSVKKLNKTMIVLKVTGSKKVSECHDIST